MSLSSVRMEGHKDSIESIPNDVYLPLYNHISVKTAHFRAMMAITFTKSSISVSIIAISQNPDPTTF